MAVTHPTATRTAVADFICRGTAAATTGLNVQGGTPPAKIVFQTAGSATVATLIMSNPSFGAAASGVCTAAAINSDTNAVGGTTTKAEIQQGTTNTPVILCSVTNTGGGGDIQLSSTVISAGQTVSISALTYTAMP
jgi:hypothetical protein